MTDTDMLYMAALEKRNAELEARVAELEEKHWNECRQIAHYSDELRKAKELLKAACEDIDYALHSFDVCEVCALRTYDDEGEACCPAVDATNCGEISKWQHEAEALALIGEDTNVPASADDTNVGGKIDSWISCEDRVPDESGKYLCYLATDEMEVVEFCREIEDDECNINYPFGVWNTYPSDDGGECREWIEILEVTHWQPLPEPPKDGEQNDF